MTHSDYMREALIVGRKALPQCLTNPPVGCVLVRDGTVIAHGHTNEPGAHHAEAMVLSLVPDRTHDTSSRDVPGDLHDVTAYVTLEPCSFHGRTPSCARELVKRGIGEVYVAMIDPDPRNQGRGIDILRDAGAIVHVGLLREEAERDLGPFLLTA